MGSTERDASQSDFKAKDGLDQGTASAADRPSLMSPPRRPVRPVRPADAPETKASVTKTSAIGVKAAPKAPAAELTSQAAGAESPPPDPAAYRYQPIAPPSEPMQYRAIGLVRGTYEPSEPDQLNRGNLTTEDGEVIDSVLLGRITSLVKKHIDLTVPHLWVVYPNWITTTRTYTCKSSAFGSQKPWVYLGKHPPVTMTTPKRQLPRNQISTICPPSTTISSPFAARW